jgi:hypothetical protein
MDFNFFSQNHQNKGVFPFEFFISNQIGELGQVITLLVEMTVWAKTLYGPGHCLHYTMITDTGHKAEQGQMILLDLLSVMNDLD